MQGVRLTQLQKHFGETLALREVNLEIRPGELFTLLGPSGCGKTTLLRLLAGLETPNQGAIYFGEQRVDNLPPHKRNIGMVFQNYAIFPHLSVAENVAYGLKARGVSGSETSSRVAEALRTVEMAEFSERRPDQLSGGQQQRVALARALAIRPALLLMDEPLANLDARLRLTMRDEIRQLQKQVGITTVYVTHDQDEALAMSDRIAVMAAGRVLQVGTPLEIYSQPAHRDVAAFVGTCAFLNGRVQAGVAELGGARFARGAGGYEGPVVVGLRPEQLRPAGGPEGALLRGQVTTETFHGAFTTLQVRLPSGETVTVMRHGRPGAHPAGSDLDLTFDPGEVYLFHPETGEALT